MHHAVANAATNYHIGPLHDNATSVFEALGRRCRGDLTVPVINRGWGHSDADIELILGGEFRRILGQIRTA